MKKISLSFIVTMLIGLLIACTPTTAESKPTQKKVKPHKQKKL
ncbi:hypothetical protein [Listeria riparia]|nr:hypothetical protein [Listeria riparia]